MVTLHDRPSVRGPQAVVLFVLGGIAFGLLATANGAGYRYGVSDQAFYIPVVLRAVDPTLFPKDAALIDAQGHLMALDEMLAGVIRATGLSFETISLAGYLVSLAFLWAAVVLIGARVYRTPWAVAALGALVSMRHRIAETSANSLEPYFHPRMLAFSCGALAVAMLLRRRPWAAVILVAIAAPIHVTTALWFSILVGVGLAILDARLRRLAVVAGVLAAALLVLAVAVGPLAGTQTRMDEVWLQAVASKDSLLATTWPVWAWLVNLGTLGLVWWMHRVRRARGQATAEDEALVWGATALVALFLATLPLVAARVALPVEFQISRVFWLVDFVAAVYVVGVLADRPAVSQAARVTALVLLAIATSRGAYAMLVERPERVLFAAHLPATPWRDAMEWLRSQPTDIHVLADPGHAWKFGASVRVAAERDVFLEEEKDSAVAIYSRDVAVRVVERTSAIGDFGALTAERARELAAQYDLDYLVAEADLPLPVAYRNERFRIYALP